MLSFKTNINLSLFIIVILLVILYLCLHFEVFKLENYEYATINDSIQLQNGSFDYNRRNKIDPGFGNQMWKLESAPDLDYSQFGQNETAGSFGQLVSRLEQRDTATEIKNLPV